ncbi:MAG: 4Fe-4S dicluster domain-containing protein [Egibacteraceae bacterium]
MGHATTTTPAGDGGGGAGGEAAATAASYAALQRRLDRMPTGAPDTAALRRILRLLFSPEEAELAAQLPSLVSVRALARRLDRDRDELDATLSSMARRGLVLDLEHRGQRWVALAPVVIGFFEFTFMRVRDDAPMTELAALFHEYLFDDPEHRFAEAAFAGSVQLGRSLVREEALPETPASEVLDYERATAVVRDAATVAVSRCPCRSHAELLGLACDAPQRTCLTFGSAAEALVRADLAEEIGTDEGLAILAEAKAAGLAQTADNVQREVSYLCNCCGCCCGMLQSIRTAGIDGAVVPSNWIAAGDLAACRGCRSGCVEACPTAAITRVDSEGRGRRRYWAEVDARRCIGCGVCVEACAFGVREMVPRDERPFTPETGLERMIAMAVERGKLGDLLVDTLPGAGPRAVARLLSHLERAPRATADRAVGPLRSVFLRGLLATVRLGTARVGSP